MLVDAFWWFLHVFDLQGQGQYKMLSWSTVVCWWHLLVGIRNATAFCRNPDWTKKPGQRLQKISQDIKRLQKPSKVYPGHQPEDGIHRLGSYSSTWANASMVCGISAHFAGVDERCGNWFQLGSSTMLCSSLQQRDLQEREREIHTYIYNHIYIYS